MKRLSFLIIALLVFSVITFYSCNKGGNTSSFDVSGRVGNVSTIQALNSSPVTADKVYAVDTAPDYGSEWRKVEDIKSDGSFEITLTKDKPWVMAFIDSTQIGPNMIKGIFSAKELDTIAPKESSSSDSTDLGDIEINEIDESAQLDESMYETFIGDIGLLSSEADYLSSVDDLMLRYINPDINGNGIIDLFDASMPDCSMRTAHDYDYGNDTQQNENLTRIRNGQDLPTDLPIEFIIASPGLGIYNDPASFQTAAKCIFKRRGPGPSPEITAENSGRGDDEYYPNSYGFMHAFMAGDPEIISGKIPDGTYIWEVYDDSDINLFTLTFSHVRTLDDVYNPHNFVFIFPKFNVDENDKIVSMDYKWMKYDGVSSQFVPANSSDIELLVGMHEVGINWDTEDGTGPSAEHHGGIGFKPHTHGYATSGTIEELGDPMMAAWSWGSETDESEKTRSSIRDINSSIHTRAGIELNLSFWAEGSF